MDWKSPLNRVRTLVKKYQYVALVLLLGIFLMMLPNSAEKDTGQEIPESKAEYDVEAQLEHMLSNIDGVGRAEVMVTEASGAQTIYQTDEDRDISPDSESLRVETVIISGTDRGEYGLVKQEIPPSYRGALIVCEGADTPSVRLAVVNAVSSITGIPTDRIAVLKMK